MTDHSFFYDDPETRLLPTVFAVHRLEGGEVVGELSGWGTVKLALLLFPAEIRSRIEAGETPLISCRANVASKHSGVQVEGPFEAVSRR